MAVTKIGSVADLKTFLGITSSNYDTVLGDILDGVSKYIINYCDIDIHQATYTNEVYDGTGTGQIRLNNIPVTTFTKLEYRDSAINENSWEEINSTLYFVDEDQGIVNLIGGFEKGKQNYRATYTAGYASGSFPEDLEYAARLMARDEYNNRKLSGNLKSEKLKDYSATYGSEGTGVGLTNEEAMKILDLYVDISI